MAYYGDTPSASACCMYAWWTYHHEELGATLYYKRHTVPTSEDISRVPSWVHPPQCTYNYWHLHMVLDDTALPPLARAGINVPVHSRHIAVATRIGGASHLLIVDPDATPPRPSAAPELSQVVRDIIAEHNAAYRARRRVTMASAAFCVAATYGALALSEHLFSVETAGAAVAAVYGVFFATYFAFMFAYATEPRRIRIPSETATPAPPSIHI